MQDLCHQTNAYLDKIPLDREPCVLVDGARDALDASAASKAADVRLRDTVNRVSDDLAVVRKYQISIQLF